MQTPLLYIQTLFGYMSDSSQQKHYLMAML